VGERRNLDWSFYFDFAKINDDVFMGLIEFLFIFRLR
jgi:hypothetical protein